MNSPPNNMSNSMSILVRYSNRFSVGGKAVNDMYISYKNRVVGSNDEAMEYAEIGSLVIITDGRYILIGEITGAASYKDAAVWERAGGRMWKYNYKMKPLTMVTKLTTLLKIIVNELTNGKDAVFWDKHQHHTFSSHTKILRRLVDEIGID